MYRAKELIKIIGIITIIEVIAAFSFVYANVSKKNALLREETAGLYRSIDLMNVHIEHLEKDNSDLTEILEQERVTINSLSTNLEQEQAKNALFESQIQTLSGTVGTLTKLSQTDRELLKKYSKVYFLSENYIPAKLTQIDQQYILKKDDEYIHTDVLSFLTRMFAEANAGGNNLKIVSAYRSFDEQAAVKTGYKVLYGSGANQFSADQGYSEHQLGTTMDITTQNLGGLSLQFEKQPGYKWLTDNAYRFGFILSYPKNNAYYQYEPWHWRFVGVELATKLHDESKRFYDVTQREIDMYLISIFDP